MQAIIDLTICPLKDEKVAGVSILKRHLLCLSKNNVSYVILIGAKSSHIKEARSDKRLDMEIIKADSLSDAIKKSYMNGFFIFEDSVYSSSIFFHISVLLFQTLNSILILDRL